MFQWMVWLGTRDEVQDFPWFKTLFKRPLTELLSSNISEFEIFLATIKS
jgi:hypothetical protein